MQGTLGTCEDPYYGSIMYGQPKWTLKDLHTCCISEIAMRAASAIVLVGLPG